MLRIGSENNYGSGLLGNLTTFRVTEQDHSVIYNYNFEGLLHKLKYLLVSISTI